MGTMANSEDTDENDASGGISSGSALFAKTKSIFRERNFFFFNYNL